MSQQEKKQMVFRKTWEEFRATGLLLFINSILHVFGWAITMEIEEDGVTIRNCWPARVKFRGFDDKSTEESHKKIADYLSENVQELKAEAYDE